MSSIAELEAAFDVAQSDEELEAILAEYEAIQKEEILVEYYYGVEWENHDLGMMAFCVKDKSHMDITLWCQRNPQLDSSKPGYRTVCGKRDPGCDVREMIIPKRELRMWKRR